MSVFDKLTFASGADENGPYVDFEIKKCNGPWKNNEWALGVIWVRLTQKEAEEFAEAFIVQFPGLAKKYNTRSVYNFSEDVRVATERLNSALEKWRNYHDT